LNPCQFCKNLSVKIVLDLGFFPPVNVMYKMSEIQNSSESFPLEFGYCTKCSLVQIVNEVNQSTVFPETYPYLSGMTKSLVDNFKQQSEQAMNLINLNENDLVLDIGSNDGSLLMQYKNKCKVLGVEPTFAAKSSLEKGIPTLESFFSLVVARDILKGYGKAKLITACNVFAHIPNLNELLKGIDEVLSEDGVFISESHYLFRLLSNLQFDTIYHEHLRYYSATFLSMAFEQFNLKIFRIDLIDSHGGSIRVWASRPGKFKIHSSVSELIKKESSKNLEFEMFLFSNSVRNWRHRFRSLIAELVLDGNLIAGVGAPSRSSTLLTFAGITSQDIFAVAEVKGSAKIGRFIPGTKIPVLDENEVLSKEPNVLLILSWHLSETLMKILRDKGFKGKFLIPLPNPVLVE